MSSIFSELTEIKKPRNSQLNSSKLLISYKAILDVNRLIKFVKSLIDKRKILSIRAANSKKHTLVLFSLNGKNRYRGVISSLDYKNIQPRIFTVKGKGKWEICIDHIENLGGVGELGDFDSSSYHSDTTSISELTESFILDDVHEEVDFSLIKQDKSESVEEIIDCMKQDRKVHEEILRTLQSQPNYDTNMWKLIVERIMENDKELSNLRKLKFHP